MTKSLVDRIDKEEDDRVKEMARKRKKDGPVIKISKNDEYNNKNTKKRESERSFCLNLNNRSLGFTREGIAGLIQRKIESRAKAIAYQAERPCVEHVRNGKPLTEKGAKMLGVAWPVDGS